MHFWELARKDYIVQLSFRELLASPFDNRMWGTSPGTAAAFEFQFAVGIPKVVVVSVYGHASDGETGLAMWKRSSLVCVHWALSGLC